MNNTTTAATKERKTIVSKTGNISLYFNLGKVWNFEDLPSKTIALDGAISGAKFDVEGEKYSLDHHAGCERTITKSTCQQVLTMLSLGFNPSGHDILVNEIDIDTALAFWACKNPQKALEKEGRDLIEIMGELDSHGANVILRGYGIFHECSLSEHEGCIDYSGKRLAKKFRYFVMGNVPQKWNFKNYSNEELTTIFLEAVEKIDQFIGIFEKIEPPEEKEKTFSIFAEKNGWVLATSSDNISELMYQNGYTGLVLCSPLNEEQTTWKYTIFRKSIFVHPKTNFLTLQKELNKLENNPSDSWGGSNTGIGSPKKDGSKLQPQEVFEVVTSL